MRDLILKWALKNAVEHGGKASAGAVVNKVMGEAKEKPDIKALGKEIAAVVADVNAMPVDEQQKKLLAMWPEALEKKEETQKELPELPGAVQGRVVLRMAPNVNGPMHIGHSRGLILNDEYAKRYAGRLILRFDDTDPDVKKPVPEAYQWHINDCEWLGVKVDSVSYASDRIPIYYKFAEKLIEAGGAYACSCAQEAAQKARRCGAACEHREQPATKSLAEWKAMLAGKYEKGQMVLKMKTDMCHPNPAVRDWVGFRIVRENHPRVGDKYRVWPMLDFSSAIDDHELGVTHILRGKELATSTLRQKYVYERLGWRYPEVKYWGRVAIHEFGKISKTDIARAIKEGKYRGWDEPRLPTLMGLRARGIRPEAIRRFWLSLGFTERDISASMAILESLNRKLAEQGEKP
jgi:glutamyl-tRNA synthetase